MQRLNGTDGTDLAFSESHQVTQLNATNFCNSDCFLQSEETLKMTSKTKTLVAGFLMAATFVAAGVVVCEVPQLASETQTLANRYHLRSRTSNFYHRASRSSNSSRGSSSKSGGFQILRFGR